MLVHFTLFHLLRFTSEGGLVSCHVGSRKEHTVRGDLHAGLYLNHVAYEKVLERNGRGGAIIATVHSDVILGGLLEQLLELFLLNPVVAGGHSHYNSYCHKDGGALDPARLPTVLHHANHQRASGRHKQNAQNVIFEILLN